MPLTSARLGQSISTHFMLQVAGRGAGSPEAFARLTTGPHSLTHNHILV